MECWRTPEPKGLPRGNLAYCRSVTELTRQTTYSAGVSGARDSRHTLEIVVAEHIEVRAATHSVAGVVTIEEVAFDCRPITFGLGNIVMA